MLRIITGVGIATAMAIAAGAAAGIYAENLLAQLPQQTAKTEKREPRSAAETPGRGGILKPLPVVIANLSGAARVGVRMEGMVVLEHEGKEDQILLARIAEDALAFIRTLDMKSLEGPIALGNLREDLTERARARSDNRVREVLIQALIVE